jgi:hypothetical protein
MGLSDDQRALLRLLAQREEGYEDIAALKGKRVDEVRAEVKDALAELQAAGEAPPRPPTKETAQAKAEKPVAAPPPSTPRPSTVAGPLSTLPPERRRLLVLTAGALAVVAIVLIAVAAIGGGSDAGSSASSGSAGSPSQTAAAENGQVTQAVLSAADGSDATGRAIFGRIGKEEIVLQVTAEDLAPSEKGTPYMVWLYRTPKLSLRVGSVNVGQAGRLGARFPIPAELLAYVASGAFDQVYVSRTSNAEYQRQVAQAKKNNAIPRYRGETVLTGKITGPIAKGGKEGR